MSLYACVRAWVHVCVCVCVSVCHTDLVPVRCMATQRECCSAVSCKHVISFNIQLCHAVFSACVSGRRPCRRVLLCASECAICMQQSVRRPDNPPFVLAVTPTASNPLVTLVRNGESISTAWQQQQQHTHTHTHVSALRRTQLHGLEHTQDTRSHASCMYSRHAPHTRMLCFPKPHSLFSHQSPTGECPNVFSARMNSLQATEHALTRKPAYAAEAIVSAAC